MSIIGKGDLATALIESGIDRDDITFFACGVSNSEEENEAEYEREINLLKTVDTKKHLVYFSSLSIYYGSGRYVKHKVFMEKFIRNNYERFTLVRIGNIMWGSNPNTLINFFKRKVKNGELCLVQSVYRYLITKDEFIHWMKLIPVGTQNEMNITGRRIFVPELFRQIQKGYYD